MKWLYDDFDSGITPEQWKSLVSDKSIFTDECLEAFNRMLDFGESATCTQLAYEYGNNAQHYSGVMTKLGERILKKTNCKEPPAIKNRENSFWPIIFVGKDVDSSLVSIEGKFSWKIREELKEALKSIDFSKYKLRENEILPNEWVYSCNPKKYDVFSAFNELPTLKWQQYESKVKVGDIVYIYISKKDAKIPAGLKYKCEVIATGLKNDNVDAKYYYKPSDIKTDVICMELKLLQTLESVKYSYDNLTSKGFVAPQGYCHLKPEVKEFIENGKILITENEIREAYKNDLQKKNPGWVRQTLATHMSDSFFIKNNKLVNDFWELFKSDSNLEEAESVLKNYFESNNFPRVQERTSGYFNDLKNLKLFIDTFYGGINNLTIIDETNLIKEKLKQIKDWFNEFLKENQEVAFDNEKYKWEEITHCQNLSGIEIAKYLVEDKTNLFENLLRVVLGELCESNSEDMTKILDALFDKKEDLHKRINNFEADIDRIKKAGRIPNDERSASVLLACHSPNEYPIFKATFYKELCKYIGIKPCSKGDEYIDYIEIIKIFADVINEDKALLNKMNELTKGFINPVNLIAQNILYVRFESSGANGDEIMETSTEYEKYIKLLESSKNLVLTGAPGTGKSYMAKRIAEEMQAEYEFVQFHPSYDYTDFVEGLRPVNGDNGQIGFERKDGVFKEFCKKALLSQSVDSETITELRKDATVWKLSLKETGDNPIRRDCLDNGYVRLGFNEEPEYISEETPAKRGKNELNAFQNKMQKGDIVLSCYSNKEIDAIGIITSDYYIDKENRSDYWRFRNVKWLVKDIRENIYDINDRTVMTLSSVYKLSIPIQSVMDIVKKYTQPSASTSDKPFVFIIDEINRGELSKIFGELFFAIDPGYRGKAGLVQTQYQNLISEGDIFKKGFYVTENVYIIGTMNDIDRSVESMDFAFRRRFRWEEIYATQNINMLEELADPTLQAEAERRMSNLNAVISNTPELSSAYNIGPAYFLKLKETQGDLNERFKALWDGHLVSLLREYLRGRSDMQTRLEEMEAAYYKEDSVD